MILLLVIAVVSPVAWLGWRDTTQPVVHTVYAEVAGLKREYRILQVADLHGREFGAGQKRLAALVAGRHYDAVAITGDMCAWHSTRVGPALEVARVLADTSRLTVFAKGNNDGDRVAPTLAAAGVHDLDGQGPVRVDGLLIETGQRLRSTSPGIEARLVIAHIPPSPEVLAGMTTSGSVPTVVLSGHMHGGQIRLPFLGGVISPPTAQSGWRFRLFPELVGVRVRGAFRDGRTDSYISPGLAGHGPRLGSRAELTEIVLRPPSVGGGN